MSDPVTKDNLSDLVSDVSDDIPVESPSDDSSGVEAPSEDSGGEDQNAGSGEVTGSDGEPVTLDF